MRCGLPWLLLCPVLLAACDSTEPHLANLDAPVAAAVMVDSTLDLGDSASSNARITWVSLDTAIATVDTTGTVVGRLPGRARIVVAADTMTHVIDLRVTARVAAIEPGMCFSTPEGLVFCGSGPVPRRIPVPRQTAELAIGAIACSRMQNGDAWCWAGRYPGDGSDSAGTTEAKLVAGGAFTALATGFEHTCGIRADSLLYCWGTNRFNAMTSQLPATVRTPQLTAGTIRFQAVAASFEFVCGLDGGGTAWCWGQNNWDQNGISGNPGGCNNDPCVGAPNRVIADSAFVAIAAGGTHNCALTASGQAWCWGMNEVGQLGDSTAAGCPRRGAPCSVNPQPVRTALRFASLVAGGDVTCALTAAGDAWCWGTDEFGAIGNGSLRQQAFPVPQRVSGGLQFRSLAPESRSMCGLTMSGDAWCWGRGRWTGGPMLDSPTPVRLAFQP